MVCEEGSSRFGSYRVSSLFMVQEPVGKDIIRRLDPLVVLWEDNENWCND
jgi:hypothetical protein